MESLELKQHFLDQIIHIEEQMWIKKDEDFDIDSLDERCYDKEQMDKLLLSDGVVGIGVTVNDSLAGFLIYKICKDYFKIIKMGAVQYDVEAFKFMLNELKRKSSSSKKRKRIEYDVEEPLTQIHKVLSANGFRATGTDKRNETYKFVFTLEKGENSNVNTSYVGK